MKANDLSKDKDAGGNSSNKKTGDKQLGARRKETNTGTNTKKELKLVGERRSILHPQVKGVGPLQYQDTAVEGNTVKEHSMRSKTPGSMRSKGEKEKGSSEMSRNLRMPEPREQETRKRRRVEDKEKEDKETIKTKEIAKRPRGSDRGVSPFSKLKLGWEVLTAGNIEREQPSKGRSRKMYWQRRRSIKERCRSNKERRRSRRGRRGSRR